MNIILWDSRKKQKTESQDEMGRLPPDAVKRARFF
jgi:hypothetical protein